MCKCYKEYLRISVIRTRFRPLLKRENAADSAASAVHLQHATESSFHFRFSLLLEKKRQMTAGYGVGKFQEFSFAYNSSPFSCLFSSRHPPSSLCTHALHLIILDGTASTLIQYKPRMIHRLSHLVTHPRAAAERGPLQSLLSFFKFVFA